MTILYVNVCKGKVWIGPSLHQDGMLVHWRLIFPSPQQPINFAGSKVFTWVNRASVRIKCLVMALARGQIKPRLFDPKSSVLGLCASHKWATQVRHVCQVWSKFGHPVLRRSFCRVLHLYANTPPISVFLV